jgi:hypothetical protein
MVAATSFLACLSIEWLNTSYTIAYTMAAASTAVVLACLVVEVRRKKFLWLVVYAPLLLLQPAWRLAWEEILTHGLRPGSSDCGLGNRGEAIFLTAMLVAVLVMLLRGHLNKRLFLLRLTVVCWIIQVIIFFPATSTASYLLLSKFLSTDVAAQIDGTVVGGAGRLQWYTLALTLISALLYLLERLRRRTQRRKATEAVT